MSRAPIVLVFKTCLKVVRTTYIIKNAVIAVILKYFGYHEYQNLGLYGWEYLYLMEFLVGHMPDPDAGCHHVFVSIIMGCFIWT